MNIIRSFFFTFIILMSPQVSDAQSFALKHYTVEDGLNSSTVYYTTQDLKGNIWFATEQGVCKFDGRTFTRYTINDGLSDNEVLFIKSDRKGRVWFLTLNGHLSYYYNGKFFNENNTSWLKKTFLGQSYNSCFADSRGNIFLGVIGDSLTVIKDDSTVQVLPQTSIGNSYFENPDKTISIYAPDGNSSLFKDDKLVSIPLRHDIRKAYCSSYINRYQFYLSNDGLIKVNGNKEEVLIPINEMFPASSLSSADEIMDSSFIITSRSGVLWFPKNVFQKDKALKLLTGKIVLSFLKDRESNFWFCTEGDGVYMLPGSQKKYLNYTISDGLSTAVINRVIKDANGNIWLGCSNSVLSEITNKKIKNFLLNDAALRNGRVLDIAIDKFDNVFAATDAGMIQMNISGQQKILGGERKDKPTGAAKCVNTNPDNFISATFSYGTYKLEYNNRNQPLFFVLLVGPEYESLRTYSHFIDKQKRLWVSDIHGLGLYENQQLNYFSNKDSLLKNRIVNMGEMPDSTLVLSTEGYGIIFFKNEKTVNHFTELNGLSSNVCRRLYVKGDTVWVSTNLGLTMLRYHNNIISDVRIFNINNGLLSNAVKDVYDDGKSVYVATEKGLCIMEDVSAQTRSEIPPVYITEILNRGLIYTLTDSVYRFNENNPVKINFSAVTFQNPSELKYRYRIPKINADWVETKNNSVEYSSIGSGKYTFEVQAKKPDSDWGKSASASFVIVPPIYKTTWFFVIAGGLIVYFLYLITKYFIQRKFKVQLAIAKQNQMLEQERMRIASDMHDDIGADLTQISMWTNILKTSDKSNPEVIARIVYSTNDVLQKMDQIIWALDSVHDQASDLISYLKECILRSIEGTEIHLVLETPDNIPNLKLSSIQRRNIFLVLKELLHNTIKHSGAGEVKIKIDFALTKLIIKYSDNGKGFDSKNTSGLGFTTMQQRMADIKGFFNFNSAKGKGFSADLSVTLG